MNEHECTKDCISLSTYPKRVEEWRQRNPPRKAGWVRPGEPLGAPTTPFGSRFGGRPPLWDAYHSPLGDDRLFWRKP